MARMKNNSILQIRPADIFTKPFRARFAGGIIIGLAKPVRIANSVRREIFN